MNFMFPPSGRITVFNWNSNERVPILDMTVVLNQGEWYLCGHIWQCLDTTGTMEEGMLLTPSMSTPERQLNYLQCTGQCSIKMLSGPKCQ